MVAGDLPRNGEYVLVFGGTTFLGEFDVRPGDRMVDDVVESSCVVVGAGIDGVMRVRGEEGLDWGRDDTTSA